MYQVWGASARVHLLASWRCHGHGRSTFSQELEDGRLVTTVHNDGTISVKLISDVTENILRSVTSCALFAPERSATAFAVVWSPDNLEIFLNDSLVASIKNAHEVPDEYRFPANNPQGSDHDFSEENAKAIAARRDRMAGHGGTPIKPGRYRSNKDQIFEALRDEILQLQDLMDLVGKGAFHHATGISSVIRKMIIKGTPLPLLQYGAATIDAPLIVFTNAQPKLAYPPDVPKPLNLIRLNVSAERRMLQRNPIDIDIWLKIPSSYINGEQVTNEFLLKKLGDTLGAHFDTDVHPAVPALRASRSRTGSGDIDFFIQLIGTVGQAVRKLGFEILEAGQD
jgi:hypothetical protein